MADQQTLCRKQLHTKHTDEMSDAHHAEMDRRLKTAAAQKGRLTCTLMWHNENDLDLTCVTPAGEKIWYVKNKDDAGTGHLDVDMNRHEDDVNHEPIENIYFEHPLPGKYRFVVEAVDMGRSPPGEKTNYHVRLQHDGDFQDKGFEDIPEDDGEST